MLGWWLLPKQKGEEVKVQLKLRRDVDIRDWQLMEDSCHNSGRWTLILDPLAICSEMILNITNKV